MWSVILVAVAEDGRLVLVDEVEGELLDLESGVRLDPARVVLFGIPELAA